MNDATGFRVNRANEPTRISRPTLSGAYFPKTEDGDEIAVYGSGAHPTKGNQPTVSLMINLNAIDLTPSEARALAFSILFQAKRIDPEGKA